MLIPKMIKINSSNDMAPVCRKSISQTDEMGTWEQNSMKFELMYNNFHSKNCILKHRLPNGGHFVQTAMC